MVGGVEDSPRRCGRFPPLPCSPKSRHELLPWPAISGCPSAPPPPILCLLSDNLGILLVRHCIGRCPGEPVTSTPAQFPPLSGLVWISHFVHAFAPRRTAETFLSAGGVRRHKLSTAPSGRMIGLMPLHFRIRGLAGYFPPRSLRRRPGCLVKPPLVEREALRPTCPIAFTAAPHVEPSFPATSGKFLQGRNDSPPVVRPLRPVAGQAC